MTSWYRAKQTIDCISVSWSFKLSFFSLYKWLSNRPYLKEQHAHVEKVPVAQD